MGSCDPSGESPCLIGTGNTAAGDDKIRRKECPTPRHDDSAKMPGAHAPESIVLSGPNKSHR